MGIGLNCGANFKQTNYETSNAILPLRVMSPSNLRKKQVGDLKAYIEQLTEMYFGCFVDCLALQRHLAIFTGYIRLVRLQIISIVLNSSKWLENSYFSHRFLNSRPLYPSPALNSPRGHQGTSSPPLPSSPPWDVC